MREVSEGGLLVKINRVGEFLGTVATCFGDLSVDHYYDVFSSFFRSGGTMKDPCQSGKIWSNSTQWTLDRISVFSRMVSRS